MSTYCCVTLVGNLGKDPEIRSLQDGGRIANLTLATSESWNDKASGERNERTQWHRVVVFNEHLVSVAESFLKKGSKVLVVGTLQTRKWTDQRGVDRYSTEVVVGRFNSVLKTLDRPTDSDGGSRGYSNEATPRERTGGRVSGAAAGAPHRGATAHHAGPDWDAPGGGDLNDEIPFSPEVR